MLKFVDVWLGGQNHRLDVLSNNIKVGYINYSRGLDSAFINHIEVDKQHRRKGYGRLLVHELRRYYPRLRGFAKNKTAQKFWFGIGGRFVSRRSFVLGD